MRVTILCPAPEASGGLRVIAIHAAWLAAHGHEVTVVAPAVPSKGRWSQRLLRRTGRTWRAAHQPDPWPYFEGFGGEVRLLGSHRPIRASDVPDADVVVATWWETAEWMAALPPTKGRWVHFVQHHEVFPWLPVERVRAVYRLPTRKVVVARWLAEVMASDYGDPGAVIVPNAIDHAQFWSPVRDKAERPTLGTLFHETPFKGFEVALSVIRRLRARWPELRVLTFGTEAPTWAAGALRDLGVELRVSPPQDELRSTYGACDVWLSCSRTEGFNLTPMEAMACRTPVVATRTGWPAESIVDGRNGYVADVDDEDALTFGCEAVLGAEPAAWRQMSEAAFATVREDSWDQAGSRFERALLAGA